MTELRTQRTALVNANDEKNWSILLIDLIDQEQAIRQKP